MNTKEKKAALKSALSQPGEGREVRRRQRHVGRRGEDQVLRRRRWPASASTARRCSSTRSRTRTRVLASRNNPKLKFVDALHVNVYDVVNSRYIVLSQAALDRLTEALSNER